MSRKKKVYICFDFDEDKSLKDLLVAQCKIKNCPFEIVDASLREEVKKKNWADKAEVNIQKADTVVVLLGHNTHQAPGVLKEVQIARKLEKRTIQLIGHKDHKYHRVPGAGVLYQWTWENLNRIFG
jgi:hypothetical protein